MYVCEDCGTPAGTVYPRVRCQTCGGSIVFRAPSVVAASATLAEAIEAAEQAESLDRFITDLPDDEEALPEERDGRWVFGSPGLIRAGFHRRLKEGDLVRAVGVVFEILGYSYTGRIYIARVFRTTWPDTTAELPKGWRPRKPRTKKEQS